MATPTCGSDCPRPNSKAPPITLEDCRPQPMKFYEELVRTSSMRPQHGGVDADKMTSCDSRPVGRVGPCSNLPPARDPGEEMVMQTVFMDKDDIGQWNAFIAEAGAFSIMQSWKWGDVKEKLGWKAHRVAVANAGELVAAAQVLIKRLPFGIGSLAYVPRGPVGNWQDQDVATRLFGALHVIARENHVAMLKVEPAVLDSPEVKRTFSSLGFCPSAYSNQPCALVILDTSADSETILRGVRDSTRRHIRAAERKGVTVRQGGVDDINTFYGLMRATAKRGGFALRSREYYEAEFRGFDEDSQAIMLLADSGGQTIGAHIAYFFGKHAAQFHLASHSGSTVSPNHLLVWEQIKWAKDRGCCTFDLGGIPDEASELIANGEELPTDRIDGLWGVCRFKRGFSKDIVTYAGSFDYVYAPRRYACIARWLAGGRTLERISSLMDTRLPR